MSGEPLSPQWLRDVMVDISSLLLGLGSCVLMENVVIMVAVTKVVGSGDCVVVSVVDKVVVCVLNRLVVSVLTDVKVKVLSFLRVVSTEVTVCVVVGCVLVTIVVTEEIVCG